MVLAGAPVNAADAVKIGVIYPLTGNAASAGQSAKDAVELGADIVNNAYPELKNLPLGATAGLPNLGGAKIELISADHQGNPQVGQQQTLRLITQEKVAAMLGSYHSSVSLRRARGCGRRSRPGLSGKPAYSTGMTGQSSGRGTCVTPNVCHTHDVGVDERPVGRGPPRQAVAARRAGSGSRRRRAARRARTA